MATDKKASVLSRIGGVLAGIGLGWFTGWAGFNKNAWMRAGASEEYAATMFLSLMSVALFPLAAVAGTFYAIYRGANDGFKAGIKGGLNDDCMPSKNELYRVEQARAEQEKRERGSSFDGSTRSAYAVMAATTQAPAPFVIVAVPATSQNNHNLPQPQPRQGGAAIPAVGTAAQLNHFSVIGGGRQRTSSAPTLLPSAQQTQPPGAKKH